MAQATYSVTGMTCGHCANAVTEEVGRLSGVRTVEVDVAAGTVTVTSEAPLARAEIRDAVTEAGYTLGDDPV
ncbi:MAG TPA: heavy-metal-associated domain-containing protein [Actinophytocola sp.]|uniref:heavy-metal-associated domain-containing protein n=1 Tax=Actinophytocola sp. TaxID=1872138 RepID=UPI002DBA4D67|nr:heavy-metal-associated domain-containing protein [Actinophytocola sp.]HEU5470674.1 heavy-metal-associated domain-containing protein [Actinophytocola sp.]